MVGLRSNPRNPAVSMDEVVSRTGFAFDASGAAHTKPMTAQEQAALESLDPDGAFAAEVRV